MPNNPNPVPTSINHFPQQLIATTANIPPIIDAPAFADLVCYNPSLGLTTKARACKGAGQKKAQESHFILLGMQENVREWTPTLPNELPFWELESQWTPESLEGNCRGQNSLD